MEIGYVCSTIIYLIDSFIGSHGLLQQDNPEYDAKRQQLYEHYHPLEFSPTLGFEEKRKLMEEWYVTQFLNAGLGSKMNTDIQY